MKTTLLYFGFIYLVFTWIRLLVVALNFLSRPFLKSVPSPIQCKKVSILIPARNEEKNIATVLEGLLLQTSIPFEIIVYNDHSTDNTGAIVEQIAKNNVLIKLIQGEELPAGWLGKNNACYQLAKHATGDYLLYLDADVQPLPTMIERAVARMDSDDLDLLSLFPHQIMKTFGERLVVPLMHNILLSLLPLFYVRASNRTSLSAANGQFMMFNTNTYKKIQPHAWVKHKVVEDIEIVKLYKKFHFKCETLLGNETINCRMYTSYTDAIKGFSKNIRAFFGNHTIGMLFYTFLSVTGVFGLFYVPVEFLIAGIISILLYHLLLNRMANRHIAMLFIIPAQAIVTFFIAIRSSIYQKTGKLEWKGRKVKNY